MANTFMRFLNVNTQLTPAALAGSTTKQVLLIGQRATGGKLILAQNGFPQPNLYNWIQLPSFANGTDCTNYMANYGFITSLGINFTLNLPAPSTVTNTNGQTVLTWSSIPAGFDALTGFALAGILSQGDINGSVVSAIINAGTATMTIAGTIGYITVGDSGTIMTLSGLNNVQYPDPNASDPITQMCWDFYQSALDAVPPTQGYPSAFISVISDRDTSISPNPVPFSIFAPDVINVSGNTVQLVYNYTSANVELVINETDSIFSEAGLSPGTPQYYINNLTNFGYLPTTTLGATLAAQSITLPVVSTIPVYYANGIFVSGSGAAGGLSYSLDGVTWLATNITTHNFYDIAYNGTLWVAVSNSGVYYSINGTTWTVSSITTGTFTGIAYTASKFVVASTAGLFYSTNGSTWTECTGDDTAGNFTCITYGVGTAGGVWIAGTVAGDAYASTDGTTFAALSISTDGFVSASFANGLFELGGNTAAGLVYSTDGATFSVSNISDTTKVSQVIYNPNVELWLATTSAGIYYSINGETWVASNIASGSFSNISYNSDYIVATSTVGIYYAAVGKTDWTLSNITTGVYNTVTYGAIQELFVTGGTPGIAVSPDGIEWSSGTLTASGTYGGMVIAPTSEGGTVTLTVTNATGSFGYAPVSITLDNTQNVFQFLNNIDLYGAVQQFPVTTKTQVTTTYADFFNGVIALNQPNQVLNNHYFTYGAAGNISVLPSSAGTLPNINNQLFIFVTYPYVAQFGDIPYENTAGTIGGARMTSALMYMLANGDTPFPSLGGSTINHLPVSSIANITSYSSVPGGTGDIAATQGWLPMAPNSGSVVTILQSNTSMTTIPNTNVQDVEFRYTHIWDSVRWVKQQVANLYQTISVLPNNAGSAFINPQFIRQFRSGIISILTQGQLLRMLQNVELYQNAVTVVQDPTNVNQVDAYIPSQIVPQLNGANVLINVFSALYNFSNLSTGV